MADDFAGITAVRVEFGADRRRRSFDGLTCEFPGMRSVVLDPLEIPALGGRNIPLAEQVNYWVDLVAGTPDRRFVLLAYCAGATFARELAARLRDALAADVVALIVEPDFVTPASVADAVAEMLDGMGAAPVHRPNLRTVRDALNYAAESLAAECPGEDPAVFRELADRYTRWAAYLLACAAEPPDATGPNTRFIGATDPRASQRATLRNLISSTWPM